MAIIGISIGAAFSLAFVLGPVVDAAFGLRGVFLAGALAGIGALGLVLFVVPTPPPPAPSTALPLAPPPAAASRLRALQVGVLCLHLVLAASFVSIPVLLARDLGLARGAHYTVYVPALLLSLLIICPLLGRSHRGGAGTALFPIAIVCVAAAELLLWLAPVTRGGIVATLTLFFAGFNYLEASLPSLISRAAPITAKGAALGTYASGQFVGTFLGGLIGGLVANACGNHGVFAVAALIALGWLAFARHHRDGEPVAADLT
jgi:MFS family permease